MKKTLLFVLLALLLPLVANAYDFESGGIYYNFNSDGTSVTVTYKTRSYNSYSGSVAIPSQVTYNSKTYDVTSIGYYAFYACSGLTSVTIPNSVTSIGYDAFYGCSGLTSITIPNSVTSIGNQAFYKCSTLTSITIPNSVTSIGSEAFYGCSGLTSVTLNANDIVSKTYSSSSNLGTIFGSQVKEYVLGDDVKGIGNAAFYGCSGLTSINIGNSVTSIGEGAFYLCSGLTSVTIPNSVTSIGSSAFSGCSGLTSVTIPNSVTSIGSSAFSGCSGLTSVTIPNSVTSIGKSAFYGCSGLTSVTIPNSVTSIGNAAFSGCSGLTSITLNANDIVSKTYSSSSNLGTIFGSQVKEYVLGDDVKGIGNYAFSGCGGLTSVTIPNSVTSIGDYAFSNCGGLTSVTIPNSVTSIGQSAFSGCGGLTSVTLNANDIVSKTYSSSSNLGTIFGSQVKEYVLGDDVKGIGNYAFYKCSGLTSVTIPNSVTSIGNAAFSGCSGLTKAEFASIESFCKITFGNSLSNPLYYAKHLYINGQEVIDVVIPNSVTSIGGYAFYGCSGLTSVTIPNSVTSIGECVFSGCTGLTSVTIPESVTSIGSSAFSGCSGLTSITIGNNVTSIGNNAFYNCSSLKSVTINSNNLVSKTYTSSSNIKTLFGSQVTEYILGDDIKSIGNYAFYNCSSLTSVTIPNSVTSIGASAFYNCSGLTSITIPNSVTSIGNSIFYNCSSLTSVNIPNSVTSIGASAFYNCSGLTKAEFENIERLCKMNFESINSNPLYYAKHLYINGQEVTDLVIPNSVTSIGNYVFGNCTGLKSIYIPESITSIGNSTFYNCSGLTSITIPNSVTSIGSNAFSGCSGLTSVTLNTNDIVSKTYTSSSNINTIFGSQVKEYIIGDDITSIGDYAFYGCSGLSSATIGNNVTKIGNYAFNNCPSLTSITIPDGVTTIRSSSFPNSTKKYVNKGSLALLAAWKSGIIPYDLTTDISLEKPTIKYSSTQTTVTVNVSPIYDGFTYLIDDVYYVEKEDDKITFDGLVPGGSKDIKLNVSLGEFSYSTTCYVSTQDMKQNVSLVKRSASSFEINGNYTKGDAEVVSESLTVNDITKTGHTAIFTGLRPQKTYYVKYNVTVKHGEETYTCTRGFDISTEALTFTTTQPKVISLGNAVVGATSNLDDGEENVGFEWRRTDWTDDFASNTGAAYLYEGTMEGYIRNLYTEKLWKVRPYYKSNDGKFYYGEWVGLDPTNTSYFEPTVHTYARIDQTENKVQISGYVQRGTDAVSKQGFKYWVQENNARGAGISIPSGAKTIEAEGRVMEVELTGLKPNTTYAYVAFVTTTEGETFYGKQLTFTTEDDPDATVLGDANGNGVVEIGDVTSVLTLMATPDATGYNNQAADANQNGEIEIGDVTTILTIMAEGD